MTTFHMPDRTWLVIVAAVVAGAAFGVGLDRAVVAQQSGIKRTILFKTDDPGSTTHEAVVGIADISPTAESGKHRHYGVELGYILEGSIVLEHEGRPTATFKAGEAFKTDGVHNARNPNATPTKILAVYIVEKGKPLADPVK